MILHKWFTNAVIKKSIGIIEAAIDLVKNRSSITRWNIIANKNYFLKE